MMLSDDTERFIRMLAKCGWVIIFMLGTIASIAMLFDSTKLRLGIYRRDYCIHKEVMYDCLNSGKYTKEDFGRWGVDSPIYQCRTLADASSIRPTNKIKHTCRGCND